MNKIHLLSITVATLALSATSKGQTYTYTQDAPMHLQSAEMLALGLAAQTKAGLTKAAGSTTDYNRYGASWADVKLEFGSLLLNPIVGLIIVKPYTAYAVCGNFASKVFRNVYGWKWSTVTLQKWNSTSKVWENDSTDSPDASQYFRAIENGTQFSQQVSVNSVKAGDICAIRYLPPYNASSTGHVMMIRRLFNSRVINNKYRLWDMEVLDCSSQAHSNDTRTVGDGVGIGQMTIVCDLNNKVQGYSWNLQTWTTEAQINATLNNAHQWQTDRPMVFGTFKAPVVP